MMNVHTIWQKRLHAFWKEALLYGSYAMRGGLGTFLLLAFIIGGYLYSRWLETLDASFPLWRLTTPLFAIVVGRSPIRTFLREADHVFLMPAEAMMQGYFRRSLLYSYASQALSTACCLLAVWPLYARVSGQEAASFGSILLLLLAAKLLSIIGHWQESRVVARKQRWCVAGMRGMGSILVAYLAFDGQGYVAAAVLLLFALLFTGIMRFLPKHATAWTYWLETEKRQLAHRYMFFSWFADVPKLPKQVKQRSWAAALAERIPLRQQLTYHYLYGKTFVRSEAFGIWFRITAAAIILLIVFPSDAIRLTVFAAAAALSALQVSTLQAAHRYTFWTQLYPINKASLQSRSASRVTAAALLLSNCLLGVLLISLIGNKLYAITEAALIVGLTLVYGAFAKRRSA